MRAESEPGFVASRTDERHLIVKSEAELTSRNTSLAELGFEFISDSIRQLIGAKEPWLIYTFRDIYVCALLTRGYRKALFLMVVPDAVGVFACFAQPQYDRILKYRAATPTINIRY